MKKLDVHFMNENPTDCPKCGARITEFQPIPDSRPYAEECYCRNCGYRFISEEDPDYDYSCEDPDAKGMEWDNPHAKELLGLGKGNA